MSELVYPPIASIILAILAIFLFSHRQLLSIGPAGNIGRHHYLLDDDDMETIAARKYEFSAGMTCREIGEEISRKYRDKTLIAKFLGAKSLKRLIDCNLLEFDTSLYDWGDSDLGASDLGAGDPGTNYIGINHIGASDIGAADKRVAVHGGAAHYNSVAFLHEFADWSALNLDHPDVFTRLSSLIEIDQMTTQALKSLPIPFLVKKIQKLRLIVKLPMKLMLTEIITTLERTAMTAEIPLEYLNFWKLFNLADCAQLDSPDRILLMRYFSLIGGKLIGDDFLAWLVKSEVFLVAFLVDLQDYNLNIVNGHFIGRQDEFYTWLEKYSEVESIVNHFIKSRLVLKQDFIKLFPISKVLRVSLVEASIGKIASKRSNLAKILMEPKPVDRNAGNYEMEFGAGGSQKPETTNFSKILGKLYNPASIFPGKERNFREFLREIGMKIESPFLLLELLKYYSSDEEEILHFIKACHEPSTAARETVDAESSAGSLDSSSAAGSCSSASTAGPAAVYDELGYVVEWVKLAFKLESPRIANFFINHYGRLLSADLPDIVLQAKSEGILHDPHKFYWHPDTGMETKAALMKRTSAAQKMENGLVIDFVDFDEEIQLLTSEEALNSEIESGRMKRENNRKIRRVLKESFAYFLDRWESLKSYKVSIIFKEMDGQDTGGLSRHFVTSILNLLLDEELGLFHRLPGTNFVVPRTLLDANVMGFVGVLHGQCLKLGIKAPWLMDLSLAKLPIKLKDLIKEISDESGGIPFFEDILVHVNEKYKIFEDRFDFSHLAVSSGALDGEIESVASKIEFAYWEAGIAAYTDNLLQSLDPKILKPHRRSVILGDIAEILKSFEFDEKTADRFLDCFEIENENTVDKFTLFKVKEAIKLALSLSPMRKSELIPKILKFVTGSSAVIGGGARGGSTLFFINILQIHDPKLKRLPRSSTCSKTIHWTVEGRESVAEMKDKFLMAVLGSQGFDLI